MPKQSSLAKLRELLRDLTLEQAKQLQDELEAVIYELEQQQSSAFIPARQDREIVQVQHSNDRLYQLERVRCGKLTCKCMGKDAKLHGPYWYAYWRENGKLKSRYIGKKLDLSKT
jgi:hypothetical protein